MVDQDGALEAFFRYRASFISDHEATNIVHTLCKALDWILIDPNKLVVELVLLTEQDYERIMTWNRKLPATIDSCVHNLIEQRSYDQPHALSVDAWDGRLEYGELNVLSSKLALHLVQLGVGPEVFVPLCFEKSMWVVVAMIAVFKAGGACVFLESSHPMNRLESILQEINANVLLTSTSTAHLFKGRTEHLVEVTESLIKSLDTAKIYELPSTKLNNAAIGLFTSGSTGKPKGIVQEHSTACTSAQTCARTFQLGPGSRVLQWAAYAFDMSVIDMLMTLVGGGCVCIPSEHDRMNNLTEVIRSMNISVACMTPSVANTIRDKSLPSLKTLVFGGEAVSREDIERWEDKVTLINAYGPAESSVCVAGRASRELPSNIGRAVGSVTWIVDQKDYNRLVPIGVIGEILIEGPLLARGYLNDPEKTFSSFIEDPAWLIQARGASRGGQRCRLYKTGDLGRYCPDGTIQFMGRKDMQIKLRGQRIEIGEVEHHLRRFLPKHVTIAVEVIVPADGQNTSKLAAFLGLGDSDDDINRKDHAGLLTNATIANQRHFTKMLNDIGDHLTKSIPAYMIPSILIPLRHIPLTVSGKVDRKKLVQLGSEMSMSQFAALSALQDEASEIENQASSTAMEKTMTGLWAKILHIHPSAISPADDFFRLGGDSINAIQLVGAARSERIELTAETIFVNPTLAGMSSIARINVKNPNHASTLKPIGSLQNTNIDTLLTKISSPQLAAQEHNIEDITDATDLQAHMVTSGLLKSHGWINYFAFNFIGPIDDLRLEASCRLLVKRHTTLRTVFLIHDARVLQVILKSHDVEFTRRKSKKDTGMLLESLCDIDVKCGVGFGDQIVRFLLVDRGTDHQTLIMRVSHAQFDGTSLPLLYRDLQRGYLGQELLKGPQFSQFVHAVKEKNTVEVEDYWRNLLKGSFSTSILLHSGPTYKNVINDKVIQTIPNVSFEETQSHGITLATIVKAAWSFVLAELSMESDIVFGYVVSGRNIPVDDVNTIVGICNNVVPVRVQLSLACTVLDLLKQIQNQQTSSIPFESLGSRQLIERCTDWPRWTRYSSGINHQNYTDADVTAFSMGDDTQCEVSFKDLEQDRRDLQIYSYLPREGKMKLAMAFCNKAVLQDFAQAMLTRLGDIIQRFSENISATLVLPNKPPKLPCRHIPIVGENDKEALKTSHPKPRPKAFSFSLLDPETIVERVWKTFLGMLNRNGLFPRTEVTLDTPYYEIGGDIVYTAQLSAIYSHEGIEFAMEDLIDYPTKRLQIDLLDLDG